jgi:hypothetical protein
MFGMTDVGAFVLYPIFALLQAVGDGPPPRRGCPRPRLRCRETRAAVETESEGVGAGVVRQRVMLRIKAPF